MFLNQFRKRSRNRRFPNPNIAAHSLRPGGYIAGSLDDFSGSRLTGWIFDAAQPNRNIKLRLLINGSTVEEFVADIFRQDIQSLANNNGMNGFEIDIDKYHNFHNVDKLIKIELVGNQRYYLGPVTITSKTNAHSLPERHHTDLTRGSIEDQLQHIFAHITATYEDNRQRIERLQNTVEMLQTFARGASTSGLSASNLAGIMHTTISGIGAFHATEMDEILERDLMAHRIESQILMNRLSA